MTLIILCSFVTISIKDTQYTKNTSIDCCYAECRYAECCYTECSGVQVTVILKLFFFFADLRTNLRDCLALESLYNLA